MCLLRLGTCALEKLGDLDSSRRYPDDGGGSCVTYPALRMVTTTTSQRRHQQNGWVVHSKVKELGWDLFFRVGWWKRKQAKAG